MEPALVLGSHTVGLGVIRALGSMGVPVVAIHYDERDMGHVSRYVERSIHAPHPEHDEDEFIGFLTDCAARYQGSFLVPSTDEALAAVSRHRSVLERDYVVGCADWEVAKRFIDKRHTYALAEKFGVPAPQTLIPRSVADVEQYAQTAEYPCLVKPRQGHLYFDLFRKKMAKPDNADQLLAAYQQATDAGLEVMLQEFIPGDASLGANYNSYSWGGKALVEFTAVKVRDAPRETGSPCVVASKWIPEITEPGRKLLQAMDFDGFACIEMKKDPRDGIYKLIEVNGRHNLSSLLAVRCGVNFPWIHYEHLVHNRLPSSLDYQTGIYWIDLLRDISSAPGYFVQERYSPMRYLKPYWSPHVFAVLDAKDPKPFRKRCLRLASAPFRRGGRS